MSYPKEVVLPKLEIIHITIQVFDVHLVYLSKLGSQNIKKETNFLATYNACPFHHSNRTQR